MPFLPETILTLLTAFQGEFTKPTWKNIQTLLIGAILCNGKRTVSAILRVMGLKDEENFNCYHYAINTAKYSGLALASILLRLLLQLIPVNTMVCIVLDETIERRKGKKISAKGCYRDACRSSESNVIKCFGLKWLCCMIIIQLPWAKRPWSLPFLTVLCTSKQHDQAKGKVHKTMIDHASRIVKFLGKALTKYSWMVLGDGSYACVKFGHDCVTAGGILISRLRLDAALYGQIPFRIPGTRGRKRIKGNKIITLKEQVKHGLINWRQQEVTWYDNVKKLVNVATGVNLWCTAGSKPLQIRWVLVQDLESGRTEAFFSTDTTLPPQVIIACFVLRWSIEVTFEELRAHLGLETQRQWSDLAIARETPALMGIFSLVCLMAYKLSPDGKIPINNTAWYNKNGNATFHDVIKFVKQAIARDRYLFNSACNDEFIKISKQEFDNILYNWFMAA